MKLVLDLDHIVREMHISDSAYAQWKADSLKEASASGAAVQWAILEKNRFLDDFTISLNHKLG